MGGFLRKTSKTRLSAILLPLQPPHCKIGEFAQATGKLAGTGIKKEIV